MKILSSLLLVVVSTFFYTQVIAECSGANRNLQIAINKPDNIYRDNGDGTVTDKETGLMWQKCLRGQQADDCASGGALNFTWLTAHNEAINANNNSDFGYSDWRIPNKNELLSLVDYACIAPAINPSVFPNTSSTKQWSSTPSLINNTEYAWTVNFTFGSVVIDTLKNVSMPIRLVRGGL